MTKVIVAREPVTFNTRELAWLRFQVWLVQRGIVSEFPRIGSN